MRILDWALLALIILAAGLAVRKIIRDRRAAHCCGNCAGCAAHRDAACAAHSDTAGAMHHAPNTNDRAG